MNLLNDVVLAVLIFFAFAVTALLTAAFTLVPQLNRTLIAYEKLAETLDTELAPTLQEVQKVVAGVGEFRQIAHQRVTEVSTKVEDVTDGLTRAAGSAKKHSSVLGAGIFAAMKAYLSGKSGDEAVTTSGKAEE